jgi:hypothetical protein
MPLRRLAWRAAAAANQESEDFTEDEAMAQPPLHSEALSSFYLPNQTSNHHMIKRYTLPDMGAIWTEENRFGKSGSKSKLPPARPMPKPGNIPAAAVPVIKAKGPILGRAHSRTRKDARPRCHRLHHQSG